MARLTKPEVQRRQRTKSGILTEHEVARIKWLLLNGWTVRQVKEIYNMSLWAIRAIDRGDTWDWVEPDNGPEEMKEGEIEASVARLATKLTTAEDAFNKAANESAGRLAARMKIPSLYNDPPPQDGKEPEGSGMDKLNSLAADQTKISDELEKLEKGD